MKSWERVSGAREGKRGSALVDIVWEFGEDKDFKRDKLEGT
jgi:hypothetical protein